MESISDILARRKMTPEQVKRRRRLIAAMYAVGPFSTETAESGDAPDSFLQFDQGGVTALHLGMI